MTSISEFQGYDHMRERFASADSHVGGAHCSLGAMQVLHSTMHYSPNQISFNTRWHGSDTWVISPESTIRSLVRRCINMLNWALRGLLKSLNAKDFEFATECTRPKDNQSVDKRTDIIIWIQFVPMADLILQRCLSVDVSWNTELIKIAISEGKRDGNFFFHYCWDGPVAFVNKSLAKC